MRLSAIVEGDGDKEAFPVLVRRIAAEVAPEVSLLVDPILRVPSSRLLQDGQLERHVELCARKMGAEGSIIILLDCDWKNGCPKYDAPPLLARARRARPDRDVSVILAYKEYESWFLAAFDSIRPSLKIADEIADPSDVDVIRGAKEWLSTRMPKGAAYAPVRDQARLTAVMNLEAARRTDSFDKCYREIARIFGIVQPSPSRPREGL